MPAWAEQGASRLEQQASGKLNYTALWDKTPIYRQKKYVMNEPHLSSLPVSGPWILEETYVELSSLPYIGC